MYLYLEEAAIPHLQFSLHKYLPKDQQILHLESSQEGSMDMNQSLHTNFECKVGRTCSNETQTSSLLLLPKLHESQVLLQPPLTLPR